MGDMYEKLRAKIAMMKNEIYRTKEARGVERGCQAGHPFGPVGKGRSGAFNTPFKFIMTFYSLCRMQQAEAGGGREGKGSVEQPNFQRELFKVFAHFSVENAIN